jgi:hypothetical protein
MAFLRTGQSKVERENLRMFSRKKCIKIIGEKAEKGCFERAKI